MAPHELVTAKLPQNETINLSELSAIRFSTSFDPDTQRIVLHDLTPSTGGQAQRGGRRSIVVD